MPDDTDRVTNTVEGDVSGTVVQIGNIYLGAPPASFEPLQRALVVEDQPLDLGEIVYLLSDDPRVVVAGTAEDIETAVRHINQAVLDNKPFDAVFLDIHMPGLNGLDLARLLARFAKPPKIVFVTADDSHAVEALELEAVGYLTKPVRPEKMTAVIDRLARR